MRLVGPLAKMVKETATKIAAPVKAITWSKPKRKPVDPFFSDLERQAWVNSRSSRNRESHWLPDPRSYWFPRRPRWWF